jgi:hypothetical protein
MKRLLTKEIREALLEWHKGKGCTICIKDLITGQVICYFKNKPGGRAHYNPSWRPGYAMTVELPKSMNRLRELGIKCKATVHGVEY